MEIEIPINNELVVVNIEGTGWVDEDRFDPHLHKDVLDYSAPIGIEAPNLEEDLEGYEYIGLTATELKNYCLEYFRANKEELIIKLV